MMNDVLYKVLIKDILYYIKSELNINLIIKVYIVVKEKYLG